MAPPMNQVKFHWQHDRNTHEDYTIDCPWGTYFKLQARCDGRGRCSGREDGYYGRIYGQAWGNQARMSSMQIR